MPADDTEPQEKALIFLHIPKTAGTTLNRIIESQYNPLTIFTLDPHRIRATVERFKTLPEKRRRRFRVVRGHLLYGIHDYLPQGATYITMLRDPVARFLSSYSFILRRPLHPLHWKLKEKGVGIEDFLRLTLRRQNLQCRVIAGVGESGECGKETLDLAKKHLERSFRVVGLCERFAESLALIAATFGWQIPYYENRKVSKVRPTVEPALIEMIKEHNRLDLDLYQFGKTLFEQEMSRNQSAVEKLLANRTVIRKPGRLENLRQSSVSVGRFALSKIASAI
ncbi:MAG TPA: sulfotransferase family 2 domain-containing protein [Chthoniobacterales bacterium]|jgi:hypothetical protein